MFICEACHSIFESENEIYSCPSCHAKWLILSAGEDKKLLVPAVRQATNEEVELYRQIAEDLNTENGLEPRIEKLKSYELSDSEYNLALMILWVYRDYSKPLIQYKLKDILTPGGGLFTSEENRNKLIDFCELAKSRFTDAISKERNSTQCNNIVKLAEKIEGESAAGVLLWFRQDEEETLKRKIPNLANIRSVDVKQIACSPSKRFVEFLIDLFNGYYQVD